MEQQLELANLGLGLLELKLDAVALLCCEERPVLLLGLQAWHRHETGTPLDGTHQSACDTYGH